MYSGPTYPSTIPLGWEADIEAEREKCRQQHNVQEIEQKEKQRQRQFAVNQKLAKLPAYRRARKIKNKAATKARRISRG